MAGAAGAVEVLCVLSTLGCLLWTLPAGTQCAQWLAAGEGPKFSSRLVGTGPSDLQGFFSAYHLYIDMDVSKNRGTPQNGWFIMENPIEMDDLGVPLFLETSVWWLIIVIIIVESLLLLLFHCIKCLWNYSAIS